MKKNFFLALALIFSCGYSVAQTTTTPKIKYGLRAGVNLARTAITGNRMEDHRKDDAENITSFQFGAYANIPFSSSFSIQPGIMLSGKGGKIQLSEAGTQLGPSEITGTVKSDLMYIEVPVNAVYRVRGLYLGAGPYAAVALSGKYKSELTSTSSGLTASEERDVRFGNNEEDDFKRSDFGVNVLAGYELKNGFNIGVNYGFGLSNLDATDGIYNKQNRVASILGGYSF